MLTSPPPFGILLCSVGVVFALSIAGCRAQRGKEGDTCEASGVSGTCQPARNCKEQVREQIRRGERPTLCGFRRNEPIMCCTLDNRHASSPVTQGNATSAAAGEKARKYCNEYKKLCVTPGTSLRRLGGTQGILVEGGVPAETNEFPHMAAIGYGEGKDIVWGCGGSLVSENFVLTAAHCLNDPRRGPAQLVRLGAEFIQDVIRGDSIRATKGQTHRVLERIRHPEYRRPAKYNDVALLKIGPALEDTAFPTLGGAIRPACLHAEVQGQPQQVSRKAIATGWGRLGFGEDVTPELQKVTLSVLDNSICNTTFDVEIRTTPQLPRGIDSSCICAGELAGGKDTCVGDSGGPLQLTNHEGSCLTQVIGITSFGKFCGFENSPAVYMRVSHFVPWIEGIVWPDS